MLIIENFIPPEEREKLTNRAVYDEEEDTWKVQPLAKFGYVALFLIISFNLFTYQARFHHFCHCLQSWSANGEAPSVSYWQQEACV
jgi:hypothetical protein